MGKLAELVKRDYDEEIEAIKDAGSLWGVGIGMAVVMAFFLGMDSLFGQPWSERDFAFALIAIIASPFIDRAWERHKVAAQMRHEREIRVEAKVDALLGLVNIKD